MKSILLATIFCTIFFILNGFAQQCGQGRFRVNLDFGKPTYPPQEVNYQLYFVYPKNEQRVSIEKLWSHASKFYYGKKDNDAGSFWKQFNGDEHILLRVSSLKAEKYIKNYDPKDYEKRASKFEDEIIKQLSGQSVHSTIEFLTLELDDTPFLLKIEKQGYQTVYLFANFWGGCHQSGTVEMQPILPTPMKSK
jgi:hypothetical protein